MDLRGRALVTGLALCLVLFAATVRWQPFNARLETPLFVLLAPCLAATLLRLGRVAVGVGAAVLVLASFPALFANATRPVVAVQGIVLPGVTTVFSAPRVEQYFASRRDALESYLHLAAEAKALACPGLALASGYDGWEYPLWVLTAPLSPEHVFVANASAELRDPRLPEGWCLVVADERPDWTPPVGAPLIAPVWAEGRLALWREVRP